MGTMWLGGVIHQPLVSSNFTVRDDLPTGQHTVTCSIVVAGTCVKRSHLSDQYQALALLHSRLCVSHWLDTEGKAKAKATSPAFSQGSNTRQCHSDCPQRKENPHLSDRGTHPVLHSKERGAGTGDSPHWPFVLLPNLLYGSWMEKDRPL